MPFLIDIPHFACKMRSEYAYDLQSHHGEFMDVLVIAADSVFGYAVGFDVLTDCGALFARLPVSALVHKTAAPELPLDYLQLWDNFSNDVEAVELMCLRGLRCNVLLKDRKKHGGTYMFTFSWKGSAFAESPGDGGFKRGHMIALDNGCYAIQPNNRIQWFEPSWITKPFPAKPDYLTNTSRWKCEQGDKWATEDSDRFFYEGQDITTNASRNGEK